MHEKVFRNFSKLLLNFVHENDKFSYYVKEAFKTLRTNFLFSGSDVKTVLITSCVKNEGKSTISIELSKSLALSEKKVLLIDGDMQLNLSLSFFSEDEVLEFASGKENLYQAIKEQKDLEGYVRPTVYNNVDLIPSSTLMSGIEYDLFTRWQREFILKNSLEKQPAK